MIDEIAFVHPKDMQDGKVPISGCDITTDLPYVEGVHLAFDHHGSELARQGASGPGHVLDAQARSAARVVYEYFGGAARFPARWNGMMAAVDRADSAEFTEEEILRPQGWVLFAFLVDPRTGLGRFDTFRLSTQALMSHLIDLCPEHDIDEILQDPDVTERVALYHEQGERFTAQLRRCSVVHRNLIVFDSRDEETIHAGNRFMIYALFPQQNVSMHVMHGSKRQNTVFAIGRSILNRAPLPHLGNLCLTYGGGGHANAGTCQVANDQAERIQGELIEKLAVGI
jgi:nanoRNase/pAp phosphatase (c-di-AMP/oligoRNAs hydrolase)